MEATDGVSKAVSLLQEVTQLLVAQTDCSSTSTVPVHDAHLPTQHPQMAVSRPDVIAVSGHDSGPSTASGLRPSHSDSGSTSCSTSRRPPVVSPTSRQLNILQRFSGLFSPYNRPSSTRLPSNKGPSGCGQSRSIFQPPKPSKRG
eukprot:Seg226.21 transcript_id=Seg226.21/GoldUCD/mRNA.D3Y31 product="hypothetical protein" protein_id=Seg226.21/GoldUCD/D3Y31